MSSNYLKVEFLDELFEESESCKYRITTFAQENHEIFSTFIKSAEKLTKGEDVKTAYRASLDLTNIKYDFLPGDTIGVLPRNNQNLTDALLIRLNLESVSDKPFELQILKGTLKKNPAIPRHLPPKSTLRSVFLNHVDIQTPPKKLFLKSLARFTEDPQERSKLEQMSSKEYTEFISTSGRTLLGLLETFPCCKPPVEVLLEHLPPLLPRPYSISSSPLSPTLDITFFVFLRDDGRKGVCTGWLEELIEEETRQEKVSFYFRQPTKFRLFPELPEPVILVATGTGIAPFRSFLQDRKLQGKKEHVWLFYGCRYKERDFLFKEEIEDFAKRRVLEKLDVAFSRGHEEKIYVQNNVEKNESDFVDWVSMKKSSIFVCGDVRTVVKDVRGSIIKILGEDFVKEMEKEGKFLIDTWL